MDNLKHRLSSLDNDELTQILNDELALIIENDNNIVIGKTLNAFVFYYLGDDDFKTTSELKNHLMSNADNLLKEYYMHNPLSLTYFNNEVKSIANEVGFENLIKTAKTQQKYSILVANGKVGYLNEEDVRFKYGLFLEIEDDLPKHALQNHFNNWISSKTAYQDYISINVCTFCDDE